MKTYLFNQEEAKGKLKIFFQDEKAKLDSFGSKVNQTFEAYTFASTIKWYKNNEWKVKINNPKVRGKEIFRLKFSTRGAPRNFSYVVCEKDNRSCQIRHQLRVSTKAHKEKNKQRANICCDIVILEDVNLEDYSTDSAVLNTDLISFGEVKHMSAFAELVAGFIGMVHELQPCRLKRIRIGDWSVTDHIAPYLNVSGMLQPTARGLDETIKNRKFDIDIYHYENFMNKL